MPKNVLTTCPTTGKVVDTQIRTEPQYFKTLQFAENVRLDCPECGQWHTLTKEKVFLDT
jgi:hypothetical protein